MADAAKLKAAVFRATNDAGDGEGDPAAMIEISEKLREHPNLIVEAVKNIKARVKDKSPAVSLLALDLLDQCMQSNGLQFQLQVQKKVLPRILKFALPNKGTHQLVNLKCANLIRSWVEYGQDGRLGEYATASKELARAEEKAQLQQRAAAQRPGAPPAPPAQQQQGGPQASRSRDRDLSPHRSDPDPGMGGYGAPGGPPPVVNLEQAQENLDLMTSMMEADAVNVRNNEVLAEVALLCKGCQVAILNQIGEVTDEAQLQRFLDLNDRLAEKLEQYESAMVPQANRNARAQQMSAMGMPMATEGQTTLSDGRSFEAGQVRDLDVASSPNYNEEDELAKAIAESAAMAEEEETKRKVDEQTLSKQDDLLALNAKARSWQSWEDTEFGHTQAQIASARLPVVQRKPLKGSRVTKKKMSPQDLVDAIADRSWVSSAETDSAPRPKPVRFTDTLK